MAESATGTAEQHAALERLRKLVMGLTHRCGGMLKIPGKGTATQRKVHGHHLARWGTYWTTGRQGQASWLRIAAELKRRALSGVACLDAEYSDEAAVNRLIAEDIAFANPLFTEGPGQ